METLDRNFFETVFRRMEKPCGLPPDAKTVESYTKRLLALKNKNLLHLLGDPESLLKELKLCTRSAGTTIVALRPAQIFFGRLTEGERSRLGFNQNPRDVLPLYGRLLTEETQRRAEEVRQKKLGQR